MTANVIVGKLLAIMRIVELEQERLADRQSRELLRAARPPEINLSNAGQTSKEVVPIAVCDGDPGFHRTGLVALLSTRPSRESGFVISEFIRCRQGLRRWRPVWLDFMRQPGVVPERKGQRQARCDDEAIGNGCREVLDSTGPG